jgi:hypothetical protein
MPGQRSGPGARLARRRFLGALALAPAALAGCAAAGPAGSTAAAGAPGTVPSAGAPPRAAAPDALIDAVREHPLAADDAPAFVFRAGAARAGEP